MFNKKVFITLGLAIGAIAAFKQDENGSCAKVEGRFSVYSVALMSAIVFPLIGILPALFIRSDADEKKFVGSLFFRCLLGFAAGSLLADVMFHLLPETMNGISEQVALSKGVQIVASFLLFMVIEKIGDCVAGAKLLGTLNLIANVLDNSSHGMTVVSAFENSIKFGVVALIATVIHEVPHEFSDFALLLKDGYSRQGAIFAQILTSLVGIASAILSYVLSSSYNVMSTCSSSGQSAMLPNGDIHGHDHPAHTSIFLPFTIGGFLYISLVGIVPEIVEEPDIKDSVLRMLSFLVGIIFIYVLVQIESILPMFFA